MMAVEVAGASPAAPVAQVDGSGQSWWLSFGASPAARALADRHYSRQSPGAAKFSPPGRTLVLRQSGAVWVTSWPRFHESAWAGAWFCTIFRRETAPGLASDLIRLAVAATRAHFGAPPALGMVTFVAPEEIRHKRDPGRCFRRAGFRPVGWTRERRRLVLQLLPEGMPEPLAALGTTGELALG